MHKHLRRLERVWIDFPIYYITTCIRKQSMFLLKTKRLKFSWKNGARLAAVMAGLLGDMSSCPIMFTSFAELNLTQRVCPTLSGIGKAGPAVRSTRWVDRGQRPRLQLCGNANFLITSFVRMKAMRKSGTMFRRIPLELAS